MRINNYIFRVALVLPLLILNGCVIADLNTLAPSDYEDYQTQTQLIIPLSGESVIAMGGRTPEINYHTATDTSQRFALDITSLAPGTKPFSQEEITYYRETGDISLGYSGDPKKNESYYCYGREIIAPAGGVIVQIADGMKENTPGRASLFRSAVGNFVVIDHGNNEYSLLAHLKTNSVTVAVEDEVVTGDILGQCGNSGHSTGPHLHYHLQDGPDWTKANGLPAKFTNYFADDVFIQRGEPVQGQILRNE